MLSAGVVLAAARINAVRSFGVIVTVDPDEFSEIVSRQDSPLVVQSEGGVFSTRYTYLVSHKGLTFYTKSVNPLSLPAGTEIVAAKSIAIPG